MEKLQSRKSKTVTSLFAFSLSLNIFSATPQVVYGEDNRVFIENSINEMYKVFARSTAVQLKNSKLSYNAKSKTYTVNPETLEESFMNVCKDERYADVVNAGNCSGFLVGEDLLVTAGHCMRSEFDCENTKWAFNFQKENLDANQNEISASEVYSCESIVNQALSYTTKNDFALVKLDRKVSSRPYLSVRTEGRVEVGTPLAVIGHPSGLPTIVADGAKVRTDDNDYFFKANLDTFGGNSGSPVFNSDTGLVEGILVRGERDYYYDEESKCNRVFKCEDEGCRGEDVTRITVIPELVPDMTPTYSNNFDSDVFL